MITYKFCLSSFFLKKPQKSFNLLKFVLVQGHLFETLNDYDFTYGSIFGERKCLAYFVSIYDDITCWFFYLLDRELNFQES